MKGTPQQGLEPRAKAGDVVRQDSEIRIMAGFISDHILLTIKKDADVQGQVRV